MTAEESPRVVRRRRGPFKRSRTGCSTCKRRGKKCDELWSPEGFCQRCLAGPWECTGRSVGPVSGSRRASSDDQQPASVGEAQAMGMGVGLGTGVGTGVNSAPPSHMIGGAQNVGINGVGSMAQSSMSATAGHVRSTPNAAQVSPGVPHAMSSRSTSVGSVSVPGPTAQGGMVTTPPLPAPSQPVGTPALNFNGQGSNSMPSVSSVAAVPSNGSTLAPPGAGFMNPSNSVGYFASMWNGSLTGRPSSSTGASTSTSGSMLHQTPQDAAQQPHPPSTLFSSPFAQPLFDWPGAGSGMPSAVLTTTADGCLAIDAPQASNPLVDGGLQDFWNDLSASFSGNANGASGGQFSFNPASRVLFLNSDKPMRQGVSLAEIYARVVESWLVGLPGPTRDYARARILALHDSNSVIRGVRYAVAAAYIFLFASDPHADPHAESRDPKPKPKLVELACRGAGIVEGTARGPTDDDDSKGANGSTGPKAAAVKKLRFYVDHVSTPFAGDIESTKWTEDAVHELRQVIVTDRRQLSDLLWGVIDLQLVEFIRGGAAPSYNMLSLGDRLVRSVFGCDHPPITLSDLRTSESFSLRLYGLSDVSRCIVQRGRRTIFRFNTADEAASLPLTTEDETWSTYLGLPDAIVILLAEITNLCADVCTNSLSPAAIKERADELEAALRAWTPTPPAMGVEASALISRTIAGELWRLSALVLLYQSVHRVGALHPVLRRAQAEILTLLASVTQLPNGDLWGFIALPSFLAATLSVAEADRQRAMTFLVRAGPERVWLDNIALVEKVWEEMDETGRAVDWHEKMVREGLSVAFF